MTDKKLHEINIANYYGEAAHAAKLKQKAAKEEDWKRGYRNYMARRMQCSICTTDFVLVLTKYVFDIIIVFELKIK